VSQVHHHGRHDARQPSFRSCGSCAETRLALDAEVSLHISEECTNTHKRGQKKPIARNHKPLLRPEFSEAV
jgi:hypothetical protein